MSQYDQIKVDLVEAARHLAERGVFKGTEGNFSIRVPGARAFAITPSGVDYFKMRPEQVCILDFDLNKVEGGAKPSIESGIHAVAYQLRADVNTVIHTHQVYASSLALIKTPIPALFDEQVRYLGRGVDIIDYAPSGTIFLRNKVKAKIRNGNNAYILQNHGVVVFGSDTERALHNIELLEKCALTYLLALCTDKKITKVPLVIREIAFAKLRQDEKRYARL
jgi:ribulose-5-phosphate 4-epimerase/fuculose-1-phosphate aldolase